MPPQSQGNSARLGNNNSIEPCKETKKFDPSEQFLADVCRVSPSDIKKTATGTFYKPEYADTPEQYLVVNRKLPTPTLLLRSKETEEKFAIGSSNENDLIRGLKSLNGISLQEIQSDLRNLELMGGSGNLQEAMARDNEYVISKKTSHQKIAEPLTYFADIGPKLFARSIVKYNNINFAVDKFEGPVDSSPLLDGAGSSTTFFLTNLSNGQQLRFSGLQSSLISKWGIYGKLDPKIVTEFFNPTPNQNKKPLTADFKVAKNTDELFAIFVADSWGVPSLTDGKTVRFVPETMTEYLNAFSLTVFEGQSPKLDKILETVDIEDLFKRTSSQTLSFKNLEIILSLIDNQSVDKSLLSKINSVSVNEESLGRYLYYGVVQNDLLKNRRISFVLDNSAQEALVNLFLSNAKENLTGFRSGIIAPSPELMDAVRKDPLVLAKVNENMEKLFISLGVKPVGIESPKFDSAMQSARQVSLDIEYFKTSLERAKVPSEISDSEIIKIFSTLSQENYTKFQTDGSLRIPPEVSELLPKLKLSNEKLLEAIKFCGENYPESGTAWRIRHLFSGNVIKTANVLRELYSDDQYKDLKIPETNKLRFEPSSITELVEALALPREKDYVALHNSFLAQVNVAAVVENDPQKKLNFNQLVSLESLEDSPTGKNARDILLSKIRLIEVEPSDVSSYRFYLEDSRQKNIFSPNFSFKFSDETRKELAASYIESISDDFPYSPSRFSIELRKLQKNVPFISQELDRQLEGIFKEFDVPRVSVESNEFEQAFLNLKALRNDIKLLRKSYIFKQPEQISDLELKKVLSAFSQEAAEMVSKSGLSDIDEGTLSALTKAGISKDKYLAAIEYTHNSSYYRDPLSKIEQLYNGAVEKFITTKSSIESVKKLLPENLHNQVADAFSILDSSFFENSELLKELKKALIAQRPKSSRELNVIIVGLVQPELLPLVRSPYISDILIVPNDEESIGFAKKKLVVKLNAEAIGKIPLSNETLTMTTYQGGIDDLIEPTPVFKREQHLAQKISLGAKTFYLKKDELVFDSAALGHSVSRVPENGEYLVVKRFDYR